MNVAPAPSTPVGELLRAWRTARSLSQMAVAHEAEISPRHLSFVETGRAQPSRQTLLVLSSVLDVPLRERNALLLAAGFAPAYRETDLDGAEMQQIRHVIEFMLRQHEPFPAVAVDRLWNLQRANESATRLLGMLSDGSPMTPAEPGRRASGTNLLHALFDPRGMRASIRNWDQVARAIIARIRREVATAEVDSEGYALLQALLQYPDVPRDFRALESDPPRGLVIPIEIVRGELSLSLFTTLTTFGTPQDVTLEELRLETFCPADAPTERRLRALADRA